MSKVILVKMEKQKFRKLISNAWDLVLNERVTLQDQI